MKVTKIKPPVVFTPVVITLESESEVGLLNRALMLASCTGYTDLRAFCTRLDALVNQSGPGA